MKEENIIRMFNALKRITKYSSYEQLQRRAEKDYGLSYEEVLEMSYENVITEAKNGLRGIKLPKPKLESNL